MDLTIDNLSVSLGKRAVLHEVSAVLRPGRVTAILGANGSGKTTLVKALAGLLRGRVHLGDRRVDPLEHRHPARAVEAPRLRPRLEPRARHLRSRLLWPRAGAVPRPL